MTWTGEHSEPPIVQYWHSAEVPAEVEELIETFRNRNPGMRHLLFDHEAAKEFIAVHHTSRELEAFRACAVPAMQADYFRYCAVLAMGGVYADVGFRCLEPLWPLLHGDRGVLFRRDPPGYLFNGLFLFSAPDHPVLRLALDIATANIERRSSEQVQIVTGPWIFSSLSVLHRLLSTDSAHRDASGGVDVEQLVEPFRREIASLALTSSGRRGIERMAGPILEAIDDPMGVVEAFERVRVEPVETMAQYVGSPSEPLPHKHSDTYWINWQKSGVSVFR